MTVVARALLEAKAMELAETTQYTCPASTRAQIDKITVTNVTGGAVTFTLKIVPSGGSVGAGNTIILAQSVAAGTCYLCPEAVNQYLSPGDFISTLCSAATSLTIRISGRETS